MSLSSDLVTFQRAIHQVFANSHTQPIYLQLTTLRLVIESMGLSGFSGI